MSGFGFRVSFWIGLAGSISERNLEAIELEIYLNFQPLRTYFEEEAATSTTRVIHQWKVLMMISPFIVLTETKFRNEG